MKNDAMLLVNSTDEITKFAAENTPVLVTYNPFRVGHFVVRATGERIPKKMVKPYVAAAS
jgi:hypothetical protein